MDFQLDLGKSEFATDFVDKILSSDSTFPVCPTTEFCCMLTRGQSSR